MRIPGHLLLLALSAGTMSACRGSDAGPNPSTPAPVTLAISDSTLQEFARRRVFFAHQSVGANILEGLGELAADDPRLRFPVVRADSLPSEVRPGLYHAFVGANRRPDAKNADFVRMLDEGFGAAVDIALLKYCYLDVGQSTNVEQLFADYRAAVDSVRQRFPSLTVVHVTQPLTTAESWGESRIRGLLGKASDRALNARRHEFNELMRATYGASGMLFDLARIESTNPDGSRATYMHAGDTVFALSSAYTDDGGHLNSLGRRVAAAELVGFLAQVQLAP